MADVWPDRFPEAHQCQQPLRATGLEVDTWILVLEYDSSAGPGICLPFAWKSVASQNLEGPDLFVDQHVYFFTGEQLCSTSFNMFLRLFYNLFCVFNGINLVNDLGNPNLPSSFPHYPQKSF